jgi:imidazolonepropionase
MSLVIDNIGELLTNDGPPLLDAAVLVDGERIGWVGPSGKAPAADRRVDARGARCCPVSWTVTRTSSSPGTGGRVRGAGWPASRTPAAASGRPWPRPGGERHELRRSPRGLVAEARRQGTTTIEIKSGYGLSVDDEAGSLRIAPELTEETTFLGAHVVPAGSTDAVRRPGAGPMLAACSPYAKWVDVFVERGAFDAEQAREILTPAPSGTGPARCTPTSSDRVPACGCGELGAASADHCTHLTDSDVDALAGSETVATLLPGAEFSTRSSYPDARRLLDAGVTVALATDCNPGSSYTSSMPFCIALAVREMRMTPAEAVRAATAGGGTRATPRRHRGAARRGTRRPERSWTRPPTCTWPTARVSP